MGVRGKGCRVSSETTKRARLLMTALHPSEHVISFIPWSAVSSHHLYNYTKCLPSVGYPCANTFKTKHNFTEITATKCLHKSGTRGKPSRGRFSTSVKQNPKGDLGLPNCMCESYTVYAQCLVSVCCQLCCWRVVNTGTPLYTHIGHEH